VPITLAGMTCGHVAQHHQCFRLRLHHCWHCSPSPQAHGDRFRAMALQPHSVACCSVSCLVGVLAVPLSLCLLVLLVALLLCPLSSVVVGAIPLFGAAFSLVRGTVQRACRLHGSVGAGACLLHLPSPAALQPPAPLLGAISPLSLMAPPPRRRRRRRKPTPRHCAALQTSGAARATHLSHDTCNRPGTCNRMPNGMSLCAMHNKDDACTCHQQNSLRSSCIPCSELLGLFCCWRC